MIYLFYGTESFLLEQELKNLQEKEQIEAINLNKYDLEATSLEDVLEDAETISLFSDKKMILVENAYIFTGTTNKKLLEQPTELLEDYANHPNPATILVFTIMKEKLDERKKIVKLLKKVGMVKELNQATDLRKFVINLLKPYQMDPATVKIFLERVGSNLSILVQEIEKLKLYKGEDKQIAVDDIYLLTSKNIDTDIFNLIENIVTHNLEQAMESYFEMMRLGEEPIKIIIMLANQFRLIYQAKVLSKKGYSEKNIADELEIHPYRIKLALQKGRIFQEDFLLKCLQKLADLDADIKHGRIEKELGFELFLLEI